MSDSRDQIVNYISERFASEDSLLQTVLDVQRAGGGPMMNIGPDQGKFLNLLVKLIKPKNILEVGSYYGYSSIWLARAIKESKLDAKLYCAEIDIKQCSVIQNFMQGSGLSEVVEVHQGSGIDLMNLFIKEKRSFEMIFIDADKANYSNYLDLAAKLIPSGGLLLVDNCIWNGTVLDSNSQEASTKAIQAFNDKLAKHRDFESTILTIQDGLAFAVKK